MDFCTIKVTKLKRGNWDYKIEPIFNYARNNDIVCKGGEMYAFWDKSKKQWNTSILDLINYVDCDILDEVEKIKSVDPMSVINALYMYDSSSGIMDKFKNYTKNMSQSDVIFNSKIIFKSDPYRKTDYSTLRLDYDPIEGPTEAFDTLTDTLYAPSEKEKILWFMGLVLTGNTSKVQKFMFIHGGKGTGKGTIIKIFQQLFADYYAAINLKRLTSESQFATEGVQEIPLLVDEDCDMSAIKDDTNLLKLTAHEPIRVDRKYMKPYTTIFNGLLITASNQAYKVRDIDSGIMRRAVTVYSSSKTFKYDVYMELMSRIKFEIPAIADKAIKVFNKLGEDYYNLYEDKEMAAATDFFLDFMRTKYESIQATLDDYEGCIPAAMLCNFYYDYLTDNEWQTSGYKRKVRNQAKRYFRKSYDRKKINGKSYRNVYEGILLEKMFDNIPIEEVDIESEGWIKLRKQKSRFDLEYSNCQAQYANQKGNPTVTWVNCKTNLEDIDTSKLHYVRPPNNHIVIDFDLKDEEGKQLYLNIEEANKFPKTYAEVSKSGQGLHLHYIYDGNISALSSVYDDHIEIKKFVGKASLRRQLTKCNNMEIAHISAGLPLKKEVNKMYDDVKDIVQNVKGMRTTIQRAIRKEYNPPHTTPNMNLIAKVFEDAQKNNVKYDLRDMAKDISIFASNSSNQKQYCMALANSIVYCNMDDEDPTIDIPTKKSRIVEDKELTFFDLEVVPNMNLVVIKHYEQPCQIFFNPTPKQIEEILSYNLVGFNNLKYDNLILYAILSGKTPYEVYEVSRGIIKSDKGISRRYKNISKEFSYTDIFDYSSDKKSLKRWEIEMQSDKTNLVKLGIDPDTIVHDEFEFDFDAPLDEEYWDRFSEYCVHDVIATEILFKYLYSDYKVRQMLSTLSGLSMNATNNEHSARIIFGDTPHPENQFNYVDLSKTFPGYKFNRFGISKDEYEVVPDKPSWTPKSLYMGEDPGEGGYVYAEPGVYYNVALLDIASMHPTSLIEMNYFGPYTQRYADLKQARIYIKHEEFEKVKDLFDGKLSPYLENEEASKSIAQALKIVLNAVYGMSSAPFPNKFKHPNNYDNIVAKRGSLFMITLKNAVQEKGYTVAHIKTDSIKIPNADKDIINYICEFGKKYGYEFEHEATFNRMALVNKAVIIAKTVDGEWEAVGAEFQQPYVLKTLFTGDEVTTEDFFITKQVKDAGIYFGNVDEEKEFDIADFEFNGGIARIYASKSGTDVIRYSRDSGRYSYVTGTSGYKWKSASEFTSLDDIDMDYYHQLAINAVRHINTVGPSGSIVECDLNFINEELENF